MSIYLLKKNAFIKKVVNVDELSKSPNVAEYNNFDSFFLQNEEFICPMLNKNK